MEENLYRFDGVLWEGDRSPTPLCPKHRLEMDSYSYDDESPYVYDHLRCEECSKDYVIPRDLSDEQKYLVRKLRAKNYLKDIKVLNLDDEAIPIAESKATSKDKKYFVKALLTESKVGQRLVVYAGERGKKDKTQIFIEPSIKRLAFDQNNIHPSDVFLKLEATFNDGDKSSINKSKHRKK